MSLLHKGKLRLKYYTDRPLCYYSCVHNLQIKVPLRGIKAYEGVELQLQIILTFELKVGK